MHNREHRSSKSSSSRIPQRSSVTQEGPDKKKLNRNSEFDPLAPDDDLPGPIENQTRRSRRQSQGTSRGSADAPDSDSEDSNPDGKLPNDNPEVPLQTKLKSQSEVTKSVVP